MTASKLFCTVFCLLLIKFFLYLLYIMQSSRVAWPFHVSAKGPLRDSIVWPGLTFQSISKEVNFSFREY